MNKKIESEFDTIFKETIEKWDELSSSVCSELYDLKEVMKMIDPPYIPNDKSSQDWVSLLNIISRLIKETHSKAEMLNMSLTGASIIRPVDKLEADTILAMRQIQFAKREDGSGYDAIHNALKPLFKLAEETVEDYSPMALLKKKLHYKDLMQGQETDLQ